MSPYTTKLFFNNQLSIFLLSKPITPPPMTHRKLFELDRHKGYFRIKQFIFYQSAFGIIRPRVMRTGERERVGFFAAHDEKTTTGCN